MSDETNSEMHPRLRMANSKTVKIALLLGVLALLAAAALIEIPGSGHARRTFVFYTIEGKLETVEERNVRVSEKKPQDSAFREINIQRYVEEAILGPVSPDSLPLFPKETRLLSLLYRDGVVYADFSEEAALPPDINGDVATNLKTLHSGIVRNFPYVRDARFFIAGKAAYAENAR